MAGGAYVPYAGDDPPVRPPFATLALVLTTLGVFGLVGAVTWRMGPDLPVRWFAALGLTPGSLRWYAPLTYWILHEHLLHLSANMLFLFVFGGAVEGAVGRRNFVALFVAAAALTGLAEAAAAAYGPAGDTQAMVIGASGPVAFMLGVFAARFHRARIRVTGVRWSVPAVPVIVAMAVGEMASIAVHAMTSRGSTAPAAAHWAHVSGFLMGIAWAHASGLVRAGKRDYRMRDADRAGADGSHVADPARWEGVLAAHPGDREATLRLIDSLAATGDRDRAGDLASDAIAADLAAHRGADAAALFVRLADLDPASRLPVESRMALGAALARHGPPAGAMHVYDAVAQTASDVSDRRNAQMRAAACAMRRASDPAEASRRLKAFLETETDPEWRAYAERLLREAQGS